MPDDLKTTLDSYASNAVLAIATFHGVAPKGSKIKSDMVAALAGILSERERVLKSLADLSKAERAVVDAILRREGKTSVRNVREELTRLGLIDKNAPVEFGPYSRLKPNPRAEKSRRLEDILARLTLHGLVFSADDPPDPNQRRYENAPKRDLDLPLVTVFIPEAIRRHLPEPPPLPEPRGAPVEVATVGESSARAFQRDLYLYWSHIRDRAVTLTAKDELPKKALGEVNAVLLARASIAAGTTESDYPRLRFLRGLLTDLKLIKVGPDRSLGVTGSTDFFALPPSDRVHRSWEAYRDGGFFSELLGLPREVRPIPANILMPAHRLIVDARRSLIKQIRKGKGDSGSRPAQSWTAFERLFDRMREANYEFLFRRPTPRTAYYYGATHPYDASTNPLSVTFPGISNESEGWDKVEANFIRAVVAGPMSWMGLVDLGWEIGAEKDRPPAAFRLTPLGAWVLDLGPRPEIKAEGGKVIVQPNFHVVALDPVNDTTLVTLDRFAERLSAERAVEYQLTRASVYAGQQAGWDAARIRQFLKQQTGAELPANVARTLDEWQAQHERIVIRPRVALAHGSPPALDEIMRDRKSAQFVASRPLPEVAILHDAKAVGGLAASLREREILPLITERPTVTPGSIVASEAGAVSFAVRAPSLYLHGHLAPFADPAEGGGYQITAETVARAARTGLSAPEILNRLAAVQRGPVSAALARRIRAWAKHYGDGAIEDVLLVQFRDQEVLEELLADPEIAALIRPFTPAPTKGLARVRASDLGAALDKLRALLAERGIELKDKLA